MRCDHLQQWVPLLLIAEHLAAVIERTPIVELVDLWHLLEKLGAAAREHLPAT